jgi:glycosyltransferase involved in cell wall biosynthesis
VIGDRVIFLSPEPPVAGTGGGGLRSASLLEYLRSKYSVDVVTFNLRCHSKSIPARVRRNLVRLAKGIPPLFDRYSGYDDQIKKQLRGPYALGMIEHFWCATYEPLLRSCCNRVILDLHNVESELAYSHSLAARWPASWVSARFADAYARLEREWLPRFDLVLVASKEDLLRIAHPHMCVYPNALPELPGPCVPEENCIVFSGNLEYHPNVEAVRWFRTRVWPRINGVEWRLIGRNGYAVQPLIRGDERIHLVGAVDNAVTELARAKICIVPLRSGSGTRFKILEAWAAGRAVVSTSIGAEGLGARDGEHLLIADDAPAFAEAVARLLENAELRRRLGAAGRALYLERYTWSAAWRSLDTAGI